MKKLFSYIIALIILSACTGPELIPEEKMQVIITESLISEAVARNMVQKASIDQRKVLDSVDFYAPVLEKYGYTIADFAYTASEMAIRKSNPLDNILNNVLEDMKRRNDMATYIYNRIRKFDTLALNYYVDTIYKKDTLIKGKFSKLKIPEIKNAKAGRYVFTMDYKISSDLRLGAKTLRYNTKGGGKQTKLSSQFWLNRSNNDEKLKEEVELKGDYDKLLFNFEENKSTSKDVNNLIDTSVMSNIMILYYPETSKARNDYLNKILMIDQLFIQDDKYKPKDFGNIPSLRQREAN